jgi:hypothetical protein
MGNAMSSASKYTGYMRAKRATKYFLRSALPLRESRYVWVRMNPESTKKNVTPVKPFVKKVVKAVGK